MLACLMLANLSLAQRGKIISPATTNVLDPNGDGFVSTTASGFSNDGYNVDEFEIPMFGLPKSADGEVLNDIQAGANCGTTELTYDNRGYSVYGVLKNGFLIFRFRVAKDRPSVEAYSILIDTDGNVGTDDPNSTANNPGFEIDITLIKNQTKGVYIYNIDGIESCATELKRYNLNSNFQISIADEVSCSDPDYFYDFYVPFADLQSLFSISENTELRFVALTNVSATCAMSGKISDIGGLDDSNYAGCNSCAFLELATNQCPTALTSLCPSCQGFRVGFTPRPSINIPLKAGETDITGKSIAGAEIYISVFGINKVLKERDTVDTQPDGSWLKVLATPLAIGDSITAQAKAFGQCNSGRASSGTSFTIVIQNIPPVLSGITNPITYTENDAPKPIAETLTITDADDTHIDEARITVTGFIPGEDVFQFSAASGITGSFNSATAVLTLTGSATVAAYQATLRSLRYSNSSENPTATTRSAQITVNDGLDDSNPYTVTISVLAVNDRPVVSAPTTVFPFVNSMKVNNAITVSDPDHTSLVEATVAISNNFINSEDALVFSNQNGISGSYNTATGVLTLSGNASLTDYSNALSSVAYTNSNGSPSLLTRRVSFTVSDGVSNSNTFFSFIDFPGVNSPPVIVDENGNAIDDLSYTIDEDTQLNECIDVNDPDGDAVHIDGFTNVSTGGIFTVTNGLCFSFVPTLNFNGIVTATVTVCDETSGALCDAATITITILPVNDPAVITETTSPVPGNTGTEICIVYTDVENDGAVIDDIVSGDSGTITDADPTDLCFVFTPNPGFVGKDTITVTICDPNDPLVCTSGEIVVDVQPDPDTDPDPPGNPDDIPGVNQPPGILIDGLPGNTLRVQIPEDSTRVFCFEAIDPEGDEVVLSTVTKLTNSGGDIALYQNIEFCFLYTALKDFNGTVEWDVTVCDNQTPALCNTVRIIVEVTPVNDPPVALPDTLVVSRNVEGTINVLLNDWDVDGDELRAKTTLVESPAHGQFSLDADGTLVYQSDRYYRGADRLRYAVCDSARPSLCAEALVIIEVTDAPLRAYEAFSPNGDGVNDYWRIEGIDFYPDNRVQLFDRFNNLVFELSGYNNENKMWRGESNHGLIGGALPEGIYFYAINLGTHEPLLKGFVVLKRE